jgi:uncharacterized small protein (DUF1192 family)
LTYLNVRLAKPSDKQAWANSNAAIAGWARSGKILSSPGSESNRYFVPGRQPQPAGAGGGEIKRVTDFSVLSSEEIARRIAILRDNIRQITEQATSQSGAADEERNAERLFRQNDELEILLKEQDRRQKR